MKRIPGEQKIVPEFIRYSVSPEPTLLIYRLFVQGGTIGQMPCTRCNTDPALQLYGFL